MDGGNGASENTLHHLSRCGSPGCSVKYCRTLIALGGPYSAGSCSSANGYGYDCSLLPLVTILCSFLLLLRKSVVLIWECGGVYVGTSGARWKSASRRKPENTQQGEAHKPGMFAATCCCCIFLFLFLQAPTVVLKVKIKVCFAVVVSTCRRSCRFYA